MEFHALTIFCFLSLALVASQAALPSELYWNSVLPNAPMPKAIKDALGPNSKEEENAYKVSWHVIDGGLQHLRRYRAEEDVIHYDPTATVFFLEKDMVAGAQMNLQITKSKNTATFLPREVADSIPFSSTKLLEILNHFSMKPDSVEAKWTKATIEECEESAMRGEDKACATSLESMIDYSTSKLGKNIEAISMDLQKETQMKKCTISSKVKKLTDDKSVVCHKENYAYAVYYCHAIKSTSAYMVPMMTADGSKVEAIAMCHKDTSAWNPKHLAFRFLKVKPGTIPICHFLSEGNVVWFRN